MFSLLSFLIPCNCLSSSNSLFVIFEVSNTNEEALRISKKGWTSKKTTLPLLTIYRIASTQSSLEELEERRIFYRAHLQFLSNWMNSLIMWRLLNLRETEISASALKCVWFFAFRRLGTSDLQALPCLIAVSALQIGRDLRIGRWSGQKGGNIIAVIHGTRE